MSRWPSPPAPGWLFEPKCDGAAAERLDLEGIVAKRKADPYAAETIWYKVKNCAYTQTEGRGDSFAEGNLQAPNHLSQPRKEG